MKIKNRTISSKEAPLIIAELGINHGGDLLVAEQMVKIAANRGCEVIKHQTHFLDDEMTPDAKKIMPPNADVSIWDVMEKCSLTKDEEIKFKENMIMTIEPGIYINESAPVDSKWKGIGIRIEDDILATNKGPINLTNEVPSHSDEIEKLMA